jgi:hypothetical protein
VEYGVFVKGETRLGHGEISNIELHIGVLLRQSGEFLEGMGSILEEFPTFEKNNFWLKRGSTRMMTAGFPEFRMESGACWVCVFSTDALFRRKLPKDTYKIPFRWDKTWNALPRHFVNDNGFIYLKKK